MPVQRRLGDVRQRRSQLRRGEPPSAQLQTSLAAAPLASPLLGAAILVGYALAAAAVAAMVPLRRDLA